MDAAASLRQDIQENARQLGRWMGLRGLITLALGILFLARPGVGVGILLGVFVVFCFLDGIALLAAAISGATLRSRGWLAFEGILGIAAGVLTLSMPGSAAVVLLFVIAIRALAVGAVEVVEAIRLGNAIPNPWLLGLIGVLQMLFGILLARNPQAGILSVTWLVGLYAVIIGVAELVAAGSLRHALKQVPPLGATPARS
jgi:uncharacterized membrane protein HdeD (DUF308 family)